MPKEDVAALVQNNLYRYWAESFKSVFSLLLNQSVKQDSILTATGSDHIGRKSMRLWALRNILKLESVQTYST